MARGQPEELGTGAPHRQGISAVGAPGGAPFTAFSGLFVLAGLAVAVCLALAGHYLNKRVHYTFCLVLAGIACVVFPFGTILGVFTILALVQDSVRESFEGQFPSEAEPVDRRPA